MTKITFRSVSVSGYRHSVTSILIAKERARGVESGVGYLTILAVEHGPHRNSGKPGIESLQGLVPGLLLQAAYSWIASYRNSHCAEH